MASVKYPSYNTAILDETNGYVLHTHPTGHPTKEQADRFLGGSAGLDESKFPGKKWNGVVKVEVVTDRREPAFDAWEFVQAMSGLNRDLLDAYVDNNAKVHGVKFLRSLSGALSLKDACAVYDYRRKSLGYYCS